MRKNRIRILSMVVFSLCLPFSLFAQIDKDMKEFDDFVKQQQKEFDDLAVSYTHLTLPTTSRV